MPSLQRKASANRRAVRSRALASPAALAKAKAHNWPKTVLTDEVFFIDDFVSAEECSSILEELEVVPWQPSLTYQRQEDGSYKDVLTGFRLSETGHQDWFTDELYVILGRVEKRIQRLFDLDTANLEFWQATNYPRNGKFDYHLDAGYWQDHRAGERILTFLLYLTTPLKGGGTHFRALDVYVEAKAGRLLVWQNLFPHGACDHRMIHSSMPLLKGKKTTLVTWLRQKKFRNVDETSRKGAHHGNPEKARATRQRDPEKLRKHHRSKALAGTHD
jgi:2OG-Fe(II) oxygenase superfamily